MQNFFICAIQGAAEGGSSRTVGSDRGGACRSSSDEGLQTLAVCRNWAIFGGRPIPAHTGCNIRLDDPVLTVFYKKGVVFLLFKCNICLAAASLNEPGILLPVNNKHLTHTNVF